MPAKADLLVVIATYNEIESLPTLVEGIFKYVENSSILIIDDGSPDGTGAWADQAAANDRRVSVIHRSGKLGLGSATKIGLQAAIDQGYSWVATMDADLSHDPATLPAMLMKAHDSSATQADVVIGSRYAAGGKIIGWPWYRQCTSRAVNIFARLCLRLPTRDNTSAYRVYSTGCLKSLDFDRLKSDGYSYLEEILVRLHQKKYRFCEVPIVFRDRQKGQSKVDFGELCRSFYQILKLSWQR